MTGDILDYSHSDGKIKRFLRVMHEIAKFKKLVMHENTESFWRNLHEYTKFKTRVLHEYTKCLKQSLHEKTKTAYR